MINSMLKALETVAIYYVVDFVLTVLIFGIVLAIYIWKNKQKFDGGSSHD